MLTPRNLSPSVRRFLDNYGPPSNQAFIQQVVQSLRGECYKRRSNDILKYTVESAHGTLRHITEGMDASCPYSTSSLNCQQHLSVALRENLREVEHILLSNLYEALWYGTTAVCKCLESGSRTDAALMADAASTVVNSIVLLQHVSLRSIHGSLAAPSDPWKDARSRCITAASAYASVINTATENTLDQQTRSMVVNCANVLVNMTGLVSVITPPEQRSKLVRQTINLLHATSPYIRDAISRAASLPHAHPLIPHGNMLYAAQDLALKEIFDFGNDRCVHNTDSSVVKDLVTGRILNAFCSLIEVTESTDVRNEGRVLPANTAPCYTKFNQALNEIQGYSHTSNPQARADACMKVMCTLDELIPSTQDLDALVLTMHGRKFVSQMLFVVNQVAITSEPLLRELNHLISEHGLQETTSDHSEEPKTPIHTQQAAAEHLAPYEDEEAAPSTSHAAVAALAARAQSIGATTSATAGAYPCHPETSDHSSEEELSAIFAQQVGTPQHHGIASAFPSAEARGESVSSSPSGRMEEPSAEEDVDMSAKRRRLH
ncbi:hypothetical protein [Anaplasma phagocytophilum]|uniref:Uncharacterized protein n=1 Tax=Anaplasma phagocytophilum (strain HZ) TaxID=212042 RepID=Q2GJQ4_ANAPZ|nr:hypothetical protein [Anaplasma phagocytophilum]ABD44259.1 hypothetical protein APH_0820 [Anaplasma phagocytophilum str. HZ]AGR79496.1 hypothetical protein YYU_03815 [Anaplasma phagocytophilum str. HZ2]KJV86723.1 hypothetical protein APHNYW_0833 [Anaplasma phagocytophilum str. ApNYW]